MLIKSPIFVNGFHRGGTNIITNLIASHPNVSMLTGETHEVFYGKTYDSVLEKGRRRLMCLPIFLAARQHIFWPGNLDERNRIPRLMQRYVDLLLYWSKMSARDNRIAVEGVERSKEEIRGARTVCKNANGVVMVTGLFAEMYPEASFIGLVRNGLALGEGYIRRGMSAREFGIMYDTVCQQMISDAARMENYIIVRFEEMISDTLALAGTVYAHVGLNLSEVIKFRLQAKRSMDKDGTRRYTIKETSDRETRWFSADRFDQYFRKDVNENQIAQLNTEDRRVILQHTERSMKALGYL